MGGSGVRYRTPADAHVIPPFRADGCLPIGAHETTPAEVEQRLVQVFAGSVTRRGLHDDWRRRRELIFEIVPLEKEWVDGSFVTLKRNPGDVDVISFIQGEAIEALSIEDRKALGAHFNSRLRSKLLFGCDGFLVPIRPPGHPERGNYELMSAHWDRWWSHDRDGVEKGYLDVRGEP